MTALPVNYEAEQALLGAVLHSAGAFAVAAGIVEAADFADGVHQRLWQRIDDAVARGETVSVLSAHRWLQSDEKLDARQREHYARQLARSLVTVANVTEYAALIRQFASRRRIIEAAEEAIAKAADISRDGNGDELLADLDRSIAHARGNRGDIVTIGQVGTEAAEALKHDLPVHPVGLEALDRALGGGLLPGKLYGLVARHKAGKTMLLTTISYNLMLAGTPHLYLCLEATPAEITQRIIGKMIGVNSIMFLKPAWRRAPDSAAAVGDAVLRLKDAPLLFQGKPRMSLDALRSAVAQAVSVHKISGVFIDYLQLVTGQQRGQSTAAWLDEITQTFAEIAKRFGIFVVVAAQENQNENVRGGEGLLNACDMSLRLVRCEEGESPNAWMAMMASRFTPRMDVGSDSNPALTIDKTAGPMFVEIGAGGDQQPHFSKVA